MSGEMLFFAYTKLICFAFSRAQIFHNILGKVIFSLLKFFRAVLIPSLISHVVVWCKVPFTTCLESNSSAFNTRLRLTRETNSRPRNRAFLDV